MQRIALLGAECTGKTRLAGEMLGPLSARGARCQMVSEYLREWCQSQGRTPEQAEQIDIAGRQQRRIEQSPAADWLIADSTPLLTAVYSDLLFGDDSLYASTLLFQRQFDFTLLTATDLPWVADGFQRSGPLQRSQFDARLRRTLDADGQAYRVIYGSGPERLQKALAGIGRGEAGDPIEPPIGPDRAGPVWRWSCEKCSDPECEHRLFTERLGLRSA